MTKKRLSLPPAWYSTLSETAAALGTHPERILCYADAGLILPAALIHKALLPQPYPGPAPYLVVRLDGYKDLPWVPDGADMVTPLLGVHRAYQLDGHSFTNVDLEAAGILIRRSQLVLTIDQVEELHIACGFAKAPHPAKLRAEQKILGLLIAERWAGNDGDYTIAEEIARGLELRGHSLSRECIAGHVREARAQFAAPKVNDDTATLNTPPDPRLNVRGGLDTSGARPALMA